MRDYTAAHLRKQLQNDNVAMNFFTIMANELQMQNPERNLILLVPLETVTLVLFPNIFPSVYNISFPRLRFLRSSEAVVLGRKRGEGGERGLTYFPPPFASLSLPPWSSLLLLPRRGKLGVRETRVQGGRTGEGRRRK